MFDRRYRGTATGAYTWIRPYIKRLRHGPRARGPIEPRDLEHVVSLYDGEIRYVDTQLERLHFELEGRDLLDRTLLVVVGDHGEEFDDHGSMEGHGWTLYEEVVRVPLILRLPGGERAGRTNQLAQLIDVAPTILEASGLAPPPAFQGRPLLPARRGEAQTRGRLAFSHTDRFTRKRSVRGERYKLIWSEEQQATPLFWPDPAGLELYDLLEDPGERHDLALERPDLVEPLRLALESWLEESTRLGAGRSPGSPVELSPAERELLRRLGYVE
jgi:arylsulfatase A-like enzyme